MKELWLLRMGCFVSLFCLAAAILSPAQTTFTTLVNFDGAGLIPYGGLIQGTDGNFYGTTFLGGTGGGTVFKITPGGTLTTLSLSPSLANPYADLVQAPGGNFYGTGAYGLGEGTVFKMTPKGTVTLLHTFPGSPSDGTHPTPGLMLGKDGYFYGTTLEGGGPGDPGTVFKVSPAGVLTILHSFHGTDGANPWGG